MNPEWLAHFANVLFGAAYLVRGILWLRILSIIACLAMAHFNYFAPSPPLWVAIYWNVIFASINSVQVWLLLREKSAISFTEEEAELYGTIFRNMSPMDYMKILRICKWQSIGANKTLITKGSPVSDILLIYDGTVLVEIDAKTRFKVREGAFLGEMAFVSGSPASGNVSTLTPTRLISWPFDELHQLFRRNPEIKSAFQSIISTDLASKLIQRRHK